MSKREGARMAFVCAATDDVRAEAEQVFSGGTGTDAGYCALAGGAATVGLAAEWKDAGRVGPELLGSRDAYRALMNGLTRIDAPYEFLGPQPMLSARLVARRLSDVASNRYGIVSVDGILPTEVLAVAADTPALKVDCDTSFRAPLQPTPAEAMLRHGAYYMHTGEVFTTTPSCDATIDQAAMTYMRSANQSG